MNSFIGVKIVPTTRNTHGSIRRTFIPCRGFVDNAWTPIPDEPPAPTRKILKSIPKIPNFVDISTAEIPFATAAPYRDSVNPTGWIITERFDNQGLRVYYDGKGYMYDKNGKLLTSVPLSFLSALPQFPLDGVLWCGRSQFDRTLAIVKGKDEEHWKNIKLQLYDAPLQHLMNYTDRLKFLSDISGINHTHVILPKPVACQSKEHLQQELENVREGGDGIYLRKPSSFYYDTSVYFKITKAEEAEAQVIGFSQDKGLECKFINGKTFVIPENNLDTIPPNGSIITVRYSALSPELVPLSPAFIRVRHDITADDIFTKDPVPFQLSYGKQKGVPRCRGCKKDFRDRKELRITVSAMFHTPGAGPYPGKLAFCLNNACLDKVVFNEAKKKDSKIVYPPFEGIIGIPKFVQQSEPQMPQLDGVAFIKL